MSLLRIAGAETQAGGEKENSKSSVFAMPSCTHESLNRTTISPRENFSCTAELLSYPRDPAYRAHQKMGKRLLQPVSEVPREPRSLS